MMIAQAADDGAATREEYFWVDQANPNEVVIRVYNSRLICCALDDGSIKKQNFFVRQVPSDVRLVRQKLGPLRPAKRSEVNTKN
jgi:hypothetical protein